ncbi:hypothetical protein Tco_0432055 [Tanacetum coccineum]
MSFLTMLDEITLESLTKEQFECFIEYYHENYPEDYKSDLENLKEVYKMMNGGVEYPCTQNALPSEIKEPYKPSPRMYSYEQPLCLRSTFVGETLRKSDQMHQTFKNSSLAMTRKLDDMVELPKSQSKSDLDMMEDKVDNPNPQSTLQVLPSIEVYTPPVTHPEEVEETIGILMEVEPLDHMKLEDLGLNTCSHDLFLISRGFPSVDEPEPQPLPNLPFLDVNLGDKRGTDPPINSYSPGSFRMKFHRRRGRSRSRRRSRSRIREVEETEEEANHIKLNCFCSDEYPFRGICKESTTSSHLFVNDADGEINYKPDTEATSPKVKFGDTFLINFTLAYFLSALRKWLEFNNRDFSANSRKEFRKKLLEMSRKEIKGPEALDIKEFGTLHEGRALQSIDHFCHFSYRQDNRSFISQAWNRLFRIREQVVREYVMEFLCSRHNAKEKVTLDDLFLLHSMDGGERVDVPWNVAKFFADKAKGYNKKSLIVEAHLIGRVVRSFRLMTLGSLRNVTLGLETLLLNVAKLVDLGICRYNGLWLGDMVDDLPDDGRDEVVADRAGEAQGEEKGVRRHPNMTFTNRLREIGERLRDIKTDVSKLSSEQDRFQTWNTDYLSRLLSYHHIDHTRYDGTHYSYVPDIPDLGVQHGVNFMSSTPVYSIAPSTYPNPFGLFGDANAGPSTSQNQGNDMDEE